jgi:hypothetical protein
MPRLVPGNPRREAARRYQNFNACLGARWFYRLELAMHVPTWMAGTNNKAGHDGTLAFSTPSFASLAYL